MNTATIDEAIDKYVNERMEKGKKTAREHFLAYVYLKHRGDELTEFMKKVAGLSRYYIHFLNVMENPFKGPEVAWFFSMITVAIFGGYLVSQEESRILGILILSGTIAHAWSLMCAVAKKWLDVGVMIAIYREIVELVENECASAT